MHGNSRGGVIRPTLLLPFLIWGSGLGTRGAAISLNSRAKALTHGALWTLVQWSDLLVSLGRVTWPAGLGRPAGNQSQERQWLSAWGEVAELIVERVHSVQLLLQLGSCD